MDDLIRIGISSCLLGQKVRYDGGHKLDNYIVHTLGQHFDFEPFCPEVEIGLGIPRETIHLIASDSGVRCVGTINSDLDVTQKLTDCANKQRHWQQQISGYILKKGSPSCGMQRVKLYQNGQYEHISVGIYAAQVMQNFPELPIEEAGRLGDTTLRENFIQRVCIYQRWQQMITTELSWLSLFTFHHSHKLTLLSHDKNLTENLEIELSEAGKTDKDPVEFSKCYIKQLMSLLKIPATRENHVAILQHLHDCLNDSINTEDSQELVDVIEQYRGGQQPLIAPITQLRKYFRKYPHENINNSYYLHPTSREQALLNNL